MSARRLGALVLVITLSCSGPRTAGLTEGGSYRAPSGQWSVNLPYEPSLCVVRDELFPLQENALFTPKIPVGLGTYQIAVTHDVPPPGQERLTGEDAWFDELLGRVAEFEGQAARLLAKDRFPGEGADCMARTYVVGGRYYLFLVRPLPPIPGGAVPGAVILSLVSNLDEDRTRLGEEPPLSLPMRGAWARLVEWSDSFVWHGAG